jgi:peptidyl-prolyl cis-trans isomerase B (cyclophilin B)
MKFALPILLLLAVGCSSDSGDKKAASDAPATPATGTDTTAQPAAAPKVDNSKLVNADGHVDKGLPKTAGYGAKTPNAGDPVVIMDTSAGRIVVRFFPEKAPGHVKNFLKLAGEGFYDGTKFHRVIPHFMIQGGDPLTKTDDKSKWGQGGPNYTIPAEFNDLEHQPGILSMARSDDPDSAGSQFFIIHERSDSSKGLDGKYTVFGEVLEGMDVLDKIISAPVESAGGLGEPPSRPINPIVIKKVEVTKWPVKLKG